MALSKQNSKHPAAWNCGYGTEIGSIVCTIAVLEDKNHQDYEPRYEHYFRLAYMNMVFNSNPLHRVIYSTTSCSPSVIRSCKYRKYGHDYVMLNCIIRFSGILNLEVNEKYDFMQAVGSQLFRLYPCLPSYPNDFVSNTCGVPLCNAVSQQLMFSTMRIRVSAVNQEKEPFMAQNDSLWRGRMSTVKVPKPSSKPEYTRPTLSKTEVARMVPKQYHRYILDGLCYTCGYKTSTTKDSETWSFHLHRDNSDIEGETSSRVPKLSDTAKLAVLNACLCLRRGCNSRKDARHHPYFK